MVVTLVAFAATTAVSAAASALEVDELARDEDELMEVEGADEDCAAAGEPMSVQARLRAVARRASRVMAGTKGCTSG